MQLVILRQLVECCKITRYSFTLLQSPHKTPTPNFFNKYKTAFHYLFQYSKASIVCELSKFRRGEMFLRSLVKLNNSISVRNFAPKFRWRPKKVFAAFWIYLSPEFRISCCHVGITCQKTEGVRHILPPSVLYPRGRHPSAPHNRRLCQYLTKCKFWHNIWYSI